MYSGLFDAIANRLFRFTGMPNNETNRLEMASVTAETLKEEQLRDASLLGITDIELSTDELLETIVLTARFLEDGQQKFEKYQFSF